MTQTTKRLLAATGLIALAVATWAATDLWGSRSIDLRHFDPDDIARRETEMWRAYYNKQRVRMFGELADLLRHQYQMPRLRSYVVGFHAARAAFVFKEGSDRSDFERALPDLMSYYGALHRLSVKPFDVDKAARLELEWWIIHRQRALHHPGDLANALAALAGEIYQMPAERFDEHARLRAEAMILRDDLAAAGGVSEEDWGHIDDLLHRSWKSLWQVVQQ